MKNLIFTIYFLFTISATWSQEPSKLTSSDSLHIKNLQHQIDSLTKVFKDRMELIESASFSNNIVINALMTGVKIESKEKYEIIENNLVKTVEVFSQLKDRINTLTALFTKDDYQKFVVDLNNPESKKLGFSFNDKVIEIVKNSFDSKKIKFGSKIIESADSLTNSPLFKGISDINPAFSIVTGIVNIVRSVGIQNDQITEKKIRDLEKDLMKYTSYYISLSKANQKLENNLNQQLESIGLLQQDLYNQLLSFTSILGFKIHKKTTNESFEDYFNKVFNEEFSEDSVKGYLKTLKTKHTKNGKIQYDELLKSSSKIKDLNNNLEEFITTINKFEFRYDEYINIRKSYSEGVKKSLKLALDNGIVTKSTYDDLIKTHEEKANKELSSIKSSINLKQLELSRKSIRHTLIVL